MAKTLAALETDIASMSFRAEYPLFPALTWEGGVTYKRNDSNSELSLHRVDLRTPDSHLQVSGTIQNLNDPLLALAAEVPRLSATELRSLFQESPLQQDLSGSVQLSGPLQNPTAKGDFQAPDGKATVIVKADLQQSPPHYEATVDLNHIVIDKWYEYRTFGEKSRATLSSQGQISTQVKPPLRCNQGNWSYKIVPLETVNSRAQSSTGGSLRPERQMAKLVRFSGMVGLSLVRPLLMKGPPRP